MDIANDATHPTPANQALRQLRRARRERTQTRRGPPTRALTMATIPCIRFWRAKPGNPSARKAVKWAFYLAFTRSPTGMAVLRAMKQVHQAKTVERLRTENASYAARQDTDSLFYMIGVRDQLLASQGGEEAISLLHSWMGHMLHIAMERAKKLSHGTIAYLELRQNSFVRLCRGRRALNSAHLRWLETGRVGFTGPERSLFLQGFDEACLISKHSSRKEVRAAFAFADRQAKAKGYRVLQADYRV